MWANLIFLIRSTPWIDGHAQSTITRTRRDKEKEREVLRACWVSCWFPLEQLAHFSIILVQVVLMAQHTVFECEIGGCVLTKLTTLSIDNDRLVHFASITFNFNSALFLNSPCSGQTSLAGRPPYFPCGSPNVQGTIFPHFGQALECVILQPPAPKYLIYRNDNENILPFSIPY